MPEDNLFSGRERNGTSGPPQARRYERKSTLKMPTVSMANVVRSLAKVPLPDDEPRSAYQVRLFRALTMDSDTVAQRVYQAVNYGFLAFGREAGAHTVTSTELGRAAMGDDPVAKAWAMAKAFAHVPAYATVVREFDGPVENAQEDAALDAFLETLGVGTNVAPRNRRIMLENAAESGWLDVARKRLREPVMTPPDPAVPLATAPVRPGPPVRFVPGRPVGRASSPDAAEAVEEAGADAPAVAPAERPSGGFVPERSDVEAPVLEGRSSGERPTLPEGVDPLLALAMTRVPSGAVTSGLYKAWFRVIEAVTDYIEMSATT